MNVEKKKTVVPGQALGYGIQYTKMASLLISAPPGSFVSFEVLDDLSVESGDGTQTYVQSKSALATNPISDRAAAFWNALANWADDIESGRANPASIKFVKIGRASC